MTKKEKVLFMLDFFRQAYGEPDCTLEYSDPLQLLIATQLAAQCTDARVNMVTPALFKRYPDCKAFAEADVLELEELIKSTGFYHNKAKNIIACAQKLLTCFDGIVPDNMEDLLTLPGVGRKTANLVLGDIFKKPAMVIDTHAKRITRLIGLTKNTDPTKVEMDMRKIVATEIGNDFCHYLVIHGRALCIARRPKCDRCGLNVICDFAKAEVKNGGKGKA